jgi:hypothetical protein
MDEKGDGLGKGSLRNSWVVDTEVPQTMPGGMEHAEGHVNREQQEKQISPWHPSCWCSSWKVTDISPYPPVGVCF